MVEVCQGGELFNYVIEKGRLDDEEARNYCRQIAQGLSAAHGAGVAHRDLKLENVLLSGDLKTVKISDFGLATMSQTAQPGCLQFTKCGSLAYAAPELIQGDGYCPFKADVRSLGVCIAALLFSKFPFDAASTKGRAYQTFLAAREAGEHNILDELAASRPNCGSALELIKACLDPDPQSRISLSNVLNHPWLATQCTQEAKRKAEEKGVAERQAGVKEMSRAKAERQAGEAVDDSTATPAGSWVRQLGWALRNHSREEFCGHLVQVLTNCGLPYEYEPTLSEFCVGMSQQVKCIVTEHAGSVCIQWERNRATPLEIKEIYQQVRRGLEQRLGTLPDIFTDGIPAWRAGELPDQLSADSDNEESEAHDESESSKPSAARESSPEHNPASIEPAAKCSPNKRKTFEGMGDDSRTAPKLGLNFTLASSAPSLRRSSSHFDLKDAEMEQYGGHQAEAEAY